MVSATLDITAELEAIDRYKDSHRRTAVS